MNRKLGEINQMLRNASNGCFALLFFLSSSSWGQVVINEIMYHGPDDMEKLEFVELLNVGGDSIDLDGWEFSDGIEYSFTEGDTVAPGAFVILARDAALFERIYGQKPDGVFHKSLNNGGERITLNDNKGHLVDTVKYDDGPHWAQSPDGASASLERINPFLPAEASFHWAPSELSLKAGVSAGGTPGQVNGNFSRGGALVIDEVRFGKTIRSPGTPVKVKAMLTGTTMQVELVSEVITPGKVGEEHVQLMERVDGNQFAGELGGLDQNSILRFRIRATEADGAVHTHPHPNELRPSYSVYFTDEIHTEYLPLFHFFMVHPDAYQSGEAYRENHRTRRSRFWFGGAGGLNEDRQLRTNALRRFGDMGRMHQVWSALLMDHQLDARTVSALAVIFQDAVNGLTMLRGELETTRQVSSFLESMDDTIVTIYQNLAEQSAKLLSGAAMEKVRNVVPSKDVEESRGFSGPMEFIARILNLEESLFQSSTLEGLSENQIERLIALHNDAMNKRKSILGRVEPGERIDFRNIMASLGAIKEALRGEVMTVLGDKGKALEPVAATPQGRGRMSGSTRGRRGGGTAGSHHMVQGNAALICKSPDGALAFFDFVNITQRKSGYKVRLGKGRLFHGMNTLNVLYESNEATTINEHLAYQLYPMTGNLGIESGYARILMNGQPAGYHLWFEQPNRNFLRRNGVNEDGNLYKVIWMGSHRPSALTPENKIPERMDIIGRFEKKTHIHDGYEDIVDLVEALENAKGDEKTMWDVIDSRFDVEQVINYYAVNMFTSHWDGFFNNYFIYNDSKGSGKWSIYPWDQDSTWSQRGGNPEELYEMPLNFGSEGAVPPGVNASGESAEGASRRGRGFFGGRGGPGWWRDGDAISRPLLAHPIFRQRLQNRLRELIHTNFSIEHLAGRIEQVQQSIEPEIRYLDDAQSKEATSDLQSFREIMDGFHKHLVARVSFLKRALKMDLP
ncbi:MAG: CotH kinase family protein [Verrucomicrobiota bacterium]|nr:CotH kinase family protein [Verrucomicrobiota bacterium]